MSSSSISFIPVLTPKKIIWFVTSFKILFLFSFALFLNIGTYLHNKTSQKAKNFGKFKTWGEILEKLHNIFEISFITTNRHNDTKRIKLK
jgi:hypothetical protein